MSIRVTCPKCHKRFNVSDKFAGKQGPCPNCKTTIKIPSKDEQVVVHEPEMSGPKSITGEAILNPIRRKEAKITSTHITLIVALLVLFLVCALVFNFMIADKLNFPLWILWISAIAIAPPICMAGYFMLRDQELGGYLGKELWVRILICSAIYALLWLAMPLSKYAFGDNYETGSWIMGLILMAGAGGAVGMLCYDLDYLMGIVHYGMYLLFCLIGRLLAGIGILPGWFGEEKAPNSFGAPATALLEQAESVLSGLAMMFGF